MANHPSAERRSRQRIKRTARNREVKGATRTALKRARAALTTGNVQLAESLVRQVEGKLDQAASKGVIHTNTASRVKSRLYAQLHRLSKAG